MCMSPELIFISGVYAELQKSREEEKQMNSLKLSFEKQLQNERTLKIQVCVRAPTQVWNILYTCIHRFLFADDCYITSFVVKNNFQLQACVELWAKSLRSMSENLSLH